MANTDQQVTSDGIDRRSLLKKAAVGGAIVVAAPTIMSTPAWALASDCKPEVDQAKLGLSARSDGVPGDINFDHLEVLITGGLICNPSTICEGPTTGPGDGIGEAKILATSWSLDQARRVTSFAPFTLELIERKNDYFLVDGVGVTDSNFATLLNSWSYPPVVNTPAGAWPVPGSATTGVLIVSKTATKDNVTRTDDFPVAFSVSVEVDVACIGVDNLPILGSEKCVKLSYTNIVFDDQASSGLSLNLENATRANIPCP